MHVACLSMQVCPPLHVHVKDGKWNWLSILSFFIFGDKVSHWSWNLKWLHWPACESLWSVLPSSEVTVSVFLYGCWRPELRYGHDFCHVTYVPTSPDSGDLLITIPAALLLGDKHLNSHACFSPVEWNDVSALTCVLRKSVSQSASRRWSLSRSYFFAIWQHTYTHTHT